MTEVVLKTGTTYQLSSKLMTLNLIIQVQRTLLDRLQWSSLITFHIQYNKSNKIILAKAQSINQHGMTRMTMKLKITSQMNTMTLMI